MKPTEYMNRWWVRLLAERELNAWLLQLRQQETGEAIKILALIVRWDPTEEQRTVLEGIARDKNRHALCVTDVINAREIPLPAERPQTRELDESAIPRKKIRTLQHACAAVAFGEVLAALRFRAISEHPHTPVDVRALAFTILPEKARAAFELHRIAGPDAVEEVGYHNRLAMYTNGLADLDEPSIADLA